MYPYCKNRVNGLKSSLTSTSRENQNLSVLIHIVNLHYMYICSIVRLVVEWGKFKLLLLVFWTIDRYLVNQYLIF